MTNQNFVVSAALALVAWVAPAPANSQMQMKTETAAMPAMDMPSMSMPAAVTLIDVELQHTSSGTSMEPPSTPMAMLMGRRGGWTGMLHGEGFLTETQQTARDERGGDKLFSVNWLMPMVQHKVGEAGQITLRAMLSLEPATVTGRYYPELFQQGETAYGKPIVDGQHPHDFVMELAALYDYRLGEHALLSLYAAPVGDPAIGPTAYPHRASAAEDPIAALGHHQEDSTHIAFNVVTAGLTVGKLRVEGSGFHGAEPTEARWHFEPSPNGHAIDSYATRLTWVPSAGVAAQYSIAEIASPEALAPGVNQRRQTASVMLNRVLGARKQMAGMTMPGDQPSTGDLAVTALWGQTKASGSGLVENSYLLEALLRFHRHEAVWTRVETAARTSELLGGGGPEYGIGHVQAYTGGYDHDFRAARGLHLAPGAQVTVYRAPDALAGVYGRTPVGAQIFVRVRLGE